MEPITTTRADPPSPPAYRRLQRNRRRGRLGGICAGIADFLGVEVTWVRLGALLSFFFSFSLSFWLYLGLWVLVPARPETPMPEVSRPLKRELRRIDRLVRRAHRQLPAAQADQVQSAFDALKIVAGELESGGRVQADVHAAWEAGRQRLPTLIDRLRMDPAADGAMTELSALEASLRDTARAALDRELARQPDFARTDSAAFSAWREHMAERRRRLRAQTGAQAQAVYQRIEDKLAFLLPRAEAHQGPFDLSPFDVKRIAYTYLPDALDEYLRLPAELARHQPMADGITAEAALTEQFIRLDNALENLAGSLFERDAQGLLIHGRFLRERFAAQAFSLKDPQSRMAAAVGQTQAELQEKAE